MRFVLKGGRGISGKVDNSNDKMRDPVCDKGGQKILNFRGRH